MWWCRVRTVWAVNIQKGRCTWYVWASLVIVSGLSPLWCFFLCLNIYRFYRMGCRYCTKTMSPVKFLSLFLKKLGLFLPSSLWFHFIVSPLPYRFVVTPCLSKTREYEMMMTWCAPVPLFSKLNWFFWILWSHHCDTLLFDNENKWFSGWPERCFGSNGNNGVNKRMMFVNFLRMERPIRYGHAQRFFFSRDIG